MKRLLITTIAILVCIFSFVSCVHTVETHEISATVLSKEHVPPHTDIQTYMVWNGKTSVPHVQLIYYDAEWNVEVSYLGVTKTVDDKRAYDTFETGDEITITANYNYDSDHKLLNVTFGGFVYDN